MKCSLSKQIVPLWLLFYSSLCFSQGAVAPDLEVLEEYWKPYTVEEFTDPTPSGLGKTAGFWSKVWDWVKDNPVTAVTAILTGDITAVTSTYVAEKSTELTMELTDEFIELVTPDPYPSNFDLRDYHLVSDIDDQDGGTCVPYSIVAAMEIEAKKRLMHFLPESDYDINLSERDLYHKFDMDNALNQTAPVMLQIARTGGYKIPLEQNTNGTNKPTVRILDYVAIPGDIDPVTQYLVAGDYFLTTIAERLAIKAVLYTRRSGVIVSLVMRDGDWNRTNLTGKENIWDENHNVCIVGWDDGACGGNGAWIIKNSWGTSTGNNGYQYLEYGARGIGWPHYITLIEFSSWEGWLNELNTPVSWVDPKGPSGTGDVLAENFGHTWCSRSLSGFAFSNIGPVTWGYSVAGVAALASYALSNIKAYECNGGILEAIQPELIIPDKKVDLTPVVNLLLLD